MASVEQINAFIEVYELQGYSAAAKKLGKGRTTIRELILTLEEQLDFLLFEIVGRKAQPTINADKLYSHAKLLQSQLVSFSGLTKSLHEAEESQILLHHDAMLPDAFMVKLTALLYTKFPYLQLSWQQGDWEEVIDSVANNETEIAFLANKKKSFNDPRLNIYFMGFNDFAVFVGKETSFRLLETIDLRNIVQIIPKSMLEEGINGYVRFSKNHLCVNNNDEACRLLSQLGWAILPIADVQQYVDRGDIYQVRPDFMFNDLKMSMATYYRPVINQGPVMSYLLSLLPQLSQDYFN